MITGLLFSFFILLLPSYARVFCFYLCASQSISFNRVLTGARQGLRKPGFLSFPVLPVVLFSWFFMGMLLAMFLLLTTPVHHERYEDQGE
jgi:hypothetical protein